MRPSPEWSAASFQQAKFSDVNSQPVRVCDEPRNESVRRGVWETATPGATSIQMSKSTDPVDATAAEANVRLSDGLSSCRSMMKEYRGLIAGVGAAAQDPPRNSATADPHH